jgi:hypothetical protein
VPAISGNHRLVSETVMSSKVILRSVAALYMHLFSVKSSKGDDV